MWDGIIPLSGLSPSAVSRQWGINVYGAVTLPIAFTNNSVIIPVHSGINFMNAKIRETSPLIKFTLAVGGNSANYEDAQWIAIGK